MDEVHRKRGQRQILMLFGIAFASMGVAWALYYLAHDAGWMKTTNNGEFVNPPMTVELLKPTGAEFKTNEKWWLWYAAPKCDTQCTKTMHNLRSVHVLLNRESTRVARAMLTDDGSVGELSPEEQEKVVLLRRPEQLREGVYIVDPIGNLVFRYPVDAAPKPVLEDLKKLLKLSQIG